MIPRILQFKPEGHYAVGKNIDGNVLVQIQDEHNKVRVAFTNKESIMLIELIQDVLDNQDCQHYDPTPLKLKEFCPECSLKIENCDCN